MAADAEPDTIVAAERIVLGAMMLNPAVIDDVTTRLSADSFYRPAHATIYTAILAARHANEPAEPVALARRLADTGTLAKVGGAAYLHACIEAVPTAANAGFYAGQVADAAQRRRYPLLAARIADLANTGSPQQREAVLADTIAELQTLTDTGSPDRSGPAATPLDWATFLTADFASVTWLAGQLMTAGQQIALVGDGKAGKSLLALEWAWRMAAGKPFLGDIARDPVRVLYVDQENTHDDIHERLTSLSATPDTLTNLIYLSFPPFKPLNSPAGAAELLAAVTDHHAQVVVLDTISRMVAGKENDADPWRDLYRLTLLKLKALGVSSIRLDHFGKDRDRGARGNSAKTQDVDHVWELRPTEQAGNVLLLTRTYTRTGKGPDELLIRRHGKLLNDLALLRIAIASQYDLALDVSDRRGYLLRGLRRRQRPLRAWRQVSRQGA